MSHFEAVYTPEQRAAVAEAYEDRRIRPATKIVKLAASGELTGEPFDIKPNYIHKLARELRHKRAGQVRSELASQPPADAIETLRRRLVNLADWMSSEQERKRKAGTLTPADLRDYARCLREIAAIPAPGAPRPPQPGARDGQGNAGSPTRGGPAAAMLKEMHAAIDRDQPSRVNATQGRSPTPLDEDVEHGRGHTENTNAAGAAPDDQATASDSWLEQRVAQLRG